jgi:hypothetical protein
MPISSDQATLRPQGLTYQGRGSTFHVCYNCGNVGHIARNCYLPPNNSFNYVEGGWDPNVAKCFNAYLTKSLSS